jgi:nucleoside phosphorylase
MPLVIFAALRWECRAVLRALKQVRRARLGHVTTWTGHAEIGEVRVIQTGMGLERAAAAADVLRPEMTTAVLSTGCAGALAAGLEAGDLVIASALVSTGGGSRVPTHPRLADRCQAIATGAGLRSTIGPVLCSPKVLNTAASKRAAAETTQAIAVEMEGTPLAERAARLGVPFASIRAVLDTSSADLTDAGSFLDPATGRVRPMAMAAFLARHPRTLPHFLAMQECMAAAGKSMARFFAALLADASGIGPEIAL